MKPRYFHQMAIAIDQLLNTILFHGWADETMSSSCYRHSGSKVLAKITMFILDLVFRPLGTHHCKNSYLNEKNRTQLPPEMR